MASSDPRPRARASTVASLMNAAAGGGTAKEKEEDEGVWQDRDVRFDTKTSSLQLRPGEVQIDAMNSVEDTKGNNGEKGSLAVTNLRMVWICARSSRINLSIGVRSPGASRGLCTCVPGEHSL